MRATQETCMVTTTRIYSFKRDIWTPYPCGWNFSPARSAARSEAFGWNDLTRAIPAQSNGLLQQKPNIRESVDRVGYELCSFRSNGTNIGKGVLELLLRWPEFWHFLNLRLHLADPLRPLLYTNSITGNGKYTISCIDVLNGRRTRALQSGARRDHLRKCFLPRWGMDKFGAVSTCTFRLASMSWRCFLAMHLSSFWCA